MTDPQGELSGIYRFTAIARPIDPAYVTNRALLIVLPIVGLLSAGLAFLLDVGRDPLSAAFSGMLSAFAAWALTRELAPDHNGAAFLALAFAWAANLACEAHLVLLLFVAMILARLVNRSTGLPLRLWDTLGVLGFCIWATTRLQQPLILVVASLAFALDARLEEPLRRHYLAAAVCLVGFAWVLRGDAGLLADDLRLWDWSLLAASALAITLFARANTEPVSYCDTAPRRLDRFRVNAGLTVGWLTAVQAVLTKGHSAWLDTPIWVCVIALLPAMLNRQNS